MILYSLSSVAKSDLKSILRWSLNTFGSDAAERYKHLLLTAFVEISEDSLILGSQEFEGMRLYHLRHSRKRAVIRGFAVKTPRHFILYQEVADGRIEIIRVLHDNMDIESITDGYA